MNDPDPAGTAGHHLTVIQTGSETLPSTVVELARTLDQLHIRFSLQRQDAAERAKKIESALLAASDLLADDHAMDPQAARCLVASLLRVVQSHED